MIIICIGDVDTGKSSLISRILINTGMITNREINKEINKSKNWLANIVDTDHNEQNKGITIHSTLEKFMLNDNEYFIVNNPGHDFLIKEIIQNSSISDITMLLISAKPNETEQSIKKGYEYSIITRVNGIKHIIICINKSEYINHDNTYENIVKKVKKALRNQYYEKITFIPTSAKLNINISKNDSNIVNYCLFDLLKSIKIHRIERKSFKTINNTLNCKVYFHKIPNLITTGYKCLLFSLNKSYDIEFINIENEKNNFITTLNSKGKFINCTLKIDTQDYINQSIILIVGNIILAYGILFKKKKFSNINIYD